MKTQIASRPVCHWFSSAPSRGGALPVVMLVVTVLTLVVGSFFAINMTHGRINHRSRLLNEARNAAQAVAEIALAEADRRAQSYSTLDANFLSGYAAPAADISFLTDVGSNISLTSIEVKAGLLSPLSDNVTLVADDPMYNGDLLNGATLKVRNGWIYSTAAAVDQRGGSSIPYYLRQLIQVREQSWIDYGIFYNMDLEFHAGPAMNIYGPVHTNANAYIAAGGALSFYDKVSAAGRIFRMVKYNSSRESHDATVKAPKLAGTAAANLVEWPIDKDATVANWYSYAGTTWKYFVRDGSFPAAYRPPAFNPKDLPSYTPEDFATAGVQMRNSAYAMIEPQLPTSAGLGSKAIEVATGTWDYSPEELKFSALSGFTISKTTSAIPWKIGFYKTSSGSLPVDKVNLPLRDSNGLPQEHPAIDPNDPDGEMDARLKAQLLRTIRYVTYTNAGAGNPPAANWGSAGSLTHIASPRMDTLTTDAYTGNLRNPDYAIYDRRQGFPYASSGKRGAFNCFIIDMEELNVLINMPDVCWQKYVSPGVAKLDPVTNNPMYFYRPDMHWSNIVYVNTGLAPADSNRMSVGGDKIRTAPVPDNTTEGTAVILTNARNLPQLYDITRFNPSKRTEGFTIATNGPVYIHGHYNADGNVNTGTSSTADIADNTEKEYDISTSSGHGANTPKIRLPTRIERPALIAADSVTVLSLNFNFSTSTTSIGDAASTEISAAIMTGLVPTQPGVDQIWAGGVHNLIRYLENWGGDTYLYRGSIIALYESEVAKRPYYENQHSNWYSPPNRDMGYHAFFVQGRIPPGVPIVRTLRRMNMERITAAEYNLAVPTPARVQ